MGITAKGRATRQRIIDGAAAHLHSAEPGELTLDDVRAITGTSKGQLFHYFPGGKEELLLAVARYEADRVLADQQPHLGALTSWPAWQRWRDAVLARYRAQGANCPLGSLMSQLTSTPGAAEVIRTLLAQWQQHIRAGIEAMQAAGRIRLDLDADRTAAAFVAGIQGGVQVLRSTGRTDHLDAVFDVLLTHLRTSPSNAATAPGYGS
ncbi:TetR family transcriptional regulator [Actinocatenispora thailandica]|uniref:TetR family transcriptional regulator n=1 Tax=Actinocatenispora thailandica TaxID=227318 RepID=A0A7R7HXS6_9ACTN|nr:TetR/AcrR family transcriptional regulator [Actinocatenispora thailandica]BCJ36273.1 TetR family transcriptional regulator [Actinocatenispora thailandica]